MQIIPDSTLRIFQNRVVLNSHFSTPPLPPQMKMAALVHPTGITLLTTQLPHQRLHPTRIHPLIFPSTITPQHQILSHGGARISSPRIKSRNQDGPTFLDDDDEGGRGGRGGRGGGGVDEFDGCQPWTITLTGVLVVAFSWILMHSVVLTSIALSLICAWWYIFLYSYPKAYSEMIADRRRKVSDGVEDTYGLRRQ
ncbi:hypothetical protein AKJ16_DCAP01940 [Drosera capensis]